MKRVKFPIESLVIQNKAFLKRLYHALERNDTNRLRRIIKRANADEIKAVCEISQNLLKGNFPKTDRNFLLSLRPYRATLRKIACVRNSIAKKKQVLQKGGAFPLLAVLAPILSSLVGSAISSAI